MRTTVLESPFFRECNIHSIFLRTTELKPHFKTEDIPAATHYGIGQVRGNNIKESICVKTMLELFRIAMDSVSKR